MSSRVRLVWGVLGILLLIEALMLAAVSSVRGYISSSLILMMPMMSFLSMVTS